MVSCHSQNKQRIAPYATIKGWKEKVFLLTGRYRTLKYYSDALPTTEGNSSPISIFLLSLLLPISPSGRILPLLQTDHATHVPEWLSTLLISFNKKLRWINIYIYIYIYIIYLWRQQSYFYRYIKSQMSLLEYRKAVNFSVISTAKLP
jgi:hypothetical protein